MKTSCPVCAVHVFMCFLYTQLLSLCSRCLSNIGYAVLGNVRIGRTVLENVRGKGRAPCMGLSHFPTSYALYYSIACHAGNSFTIRLLYYVDTNGAELNVHITRVSISHGPKKLSVMKKFLYCSRCIKTYVRLSRTGGNLIRKSKSLM